MVTGERIRAQERGFFGGGYPTIHPYSYLGYADHAAGVPRGSGKGREGMMQAAAAVLGRQPIDDNEADAVHVARWAAAEYA